MLSVSDLSLERVIWIIKAVNDNHLVIGSVLGVDLNEQAESIDPEVLPVIATGAVNKASYGLSRFLYQSVVRVDTGDRSNTLVRDGCRNEECAGGMYGTASSNDVLL